MTVTYRHIRFARRPCVWAAAALCLCFLAAGALHGAAPLYWTCCSLLGLAVLTALRRSPASGLELDRRNLTAFADGRSWRFDLNDICHVELKRGAGGPADLIVQFRNGRRTRLPILSTPNPGRLACALARYGLRLHRC